MKYDYRLIRNNYFPIIEVILKCNENKIRTDALVDSGASISLFKGEIARALGIEVASGEKKIFQGVSAKLVGYIHIVNLKIAGEEFKAKIAFSDDLSTSFNLIGRLDIFTKFDITFKDKDKQLIIE